MLRQLASDSLQQEADHDTGTDRMELRASKSDEEKYLPNMRTVHTTEHFNGLGKQNDLAMDWLRYKFHMFGKLAWHESADMHV